MIAPSFCGRAHSVLLCGYGKDAEKGLFTAKNRKSKEAGFIEEHKMRVIQRIADETVLNGQPVPEFRG